MVSGTSRVARFAAAFASAGLLFLACGSASDDVVGGDTARSIDDLEVRVGSGEPWAPVETVAEVAGMADLVAVIEVRDTTTDPAPPTGEGAVARMATARIHEVVWAPPADGGAALDVGASIRLGAGLVGHRDGKYSYRIVADTQPWFEAGSFYLVALVNAYGGWGVLPWTSFAVDGSVVRPLEGQHETPFGASVSGVELQQVQAQLGGALSDAEQVELRREAPERRIDAVLEERIAAAREADPGD